MKRQLRLSHAHKNFALSLFALLSIAASPVASGSDLVISGAIDGPLIRRYAQGSGILCLE